MRVYHRLLLLVLSLLLCATRSAAEPSQRITSSLQRAGFEDRQSSAAAPLGSATAATMTAAMDQYDAELEEMKKGRLGRQLLRLLQKEDEDEEGGAGDFLPEGFSLWIFILLLILALCCISGLMCCFCCADMFCSIFECCDICG